ncbi:MAG: aspartate carbamoyltransferase [Negativicutes bacterium]|jgi:aspartate carbamoyltransferase catalytic subunit
MKHIISCEQFSRSSLEELFIHTDDIRNNPGKYSNSLENKVVATLFYEPSTRTRLSFEAAILRLGGKNISTENAKEASSAIKGESIEDTVRVVQGYCDAIVMRHYDKNSATAAASVATVPIFNAGAGSGEHPTQGLLDMYTIFRHKPGIDGITVAVVGDLRYGRTVHSLVKLLTLYKNITIYGLSCEALALPQEYIDYVEEHGARYFACQTFADVPADVDVIYQTRTQLERFENAGIEIKEFIIDKNVMNRFSATTLLLHPLPRNAEIASEMDDDPRALYFEQTHNGMYIRMALLDGVMNGTKPN